MNMRDNPNLHLATDNVKNNTFIAVLHFTVVYLVLRNFKQFYAREIVGCYYDTNDTPYILLWVI
jgi:hypothetical protein